MRLARVDALVPDGHGGSGVDVLVLLARAHPLPYRGLRWEVEVGVTGDEARGERCRMWEGPSRAAAGSERECHCFRRPAEPPESSRGEGE